VTRVCVYGAGAIGGHIAARLARGGAEVSVVARGAQLAALQANGVRVHAPDGEIVAPVHASANPADLGEQDAVVVTVKAPALPAVAAAIGPLLGRDTKVAFVMNGIPWFYFHAYGGDLDGRRLPLVDPGDALWQAIGPERSIAGVVYSACEVIEPGVIKVENPNSRVVLGEMDGQLSAGSETLGALIRAGGMIAEMSDDIRSAIWTKLFMNLSAGPLAVLTASPPIGYYREPETANIVRAVVAEGMAVATALGCKPHVDVEAQIKRGQSGTHKPSILQDLELGRPMEIDGIFGGAQELAGLAGVPTPTLDMLVALVRARARAAGLYGG
jgi:2-dehydropantoate 2-reductase